MSEQCSNKIIYSGKIFELDSFPLWGLLQRIELKYVSGYNRVNGSGYESLWDIIDGRLYLVNLKSYSIDISEIYKDGEKLFADWYSGTLRIGCEEISDLDWGTTREYWLNLNIKNGAVYSQYFSSKINTFIDFDRGVLNGVNVFDIFRRFRFEYDVSFVKDFISRIIDYFLYQKSTRNLVLPDIQLTQEDISFLEDPRLHEFYYEMEIVDGVCELWFHAKELSCYIDQVIDMFIKIFEFPFSIASNSKTNDNLHVGYKGHHIFNNFDEIIFCLLDKDAASVEPSRLRLSQKVEIIKRIKLTKTSYGGIAFSAEISEEKYSFPPSFLNEYQRLYEIRNNLKWNSDVQKFIPNEIENIKKILEVPLIDVPYRVEM